VTRKIIWEQGCFDTMIVKGTWFSGGLRSVTFMIGLEILNAFSDINACILWERSKKNNTDKT